MSNTKPIEGDYLVFLRKGNSNRRKLNGRMPFYRHKTFEQAEAEANRLLGLMPDSTFVIWREVATIKNRSPLPSPEESISVAPDTSDEPPLETAKAGATGDPA